MEDFRKLFYEEAQDLLSKLEESLLTLEDDPKNKELINEVFRIMHSLKGSGAMFGFKNLSSFTHELESLYDQIRSDNLDLNTDIINFTMNAIDHIKELLEDDDSTESVDKTEDQKTILSNLLHNNGITSSEYSEKENQNDAIPITKDEPINKIYYIYFEPGEDILNDGTNPLYLIDEIADMGKTIIGINHSNMPEFRSFNPLKTYLSWTIVLSTEASLTEINDIFIFVEDNSKIVIEVLSDKDLFSINNAKSTFEYLLTSKPEDIESFKNIAATFESEIGQNETIDIVDDINKLENENNSINKKNKNSNIDETPRNKTVKLPEVLNIETVKVSSKKLDKLINLVSELVTTQARLVTISNNTKSLELTGLSEDFQHLSRQFRDIAFDMRLIPIQTMIVKFKRLIRDLAANLNKKIKFVTEGTETELDKNIIATISDPIMHVIRNAVDHGIETPEERVKNGKTETGTIYLKAEYSGTSILITVKDDGAGINTDKVLEKAIDKNLVQAGTELTTKEINNLLLLPGFSTSDTVSDVSGRGVGMDVVQKNIKELRGEINISSKSGEGTQIVIRLPLTLSIIDGLLISINSNKFVVPLSSVKQIYQVNREAITNSYNEVIEIEGQQFPFIDLTSKFDNEGIPNHILHFITVSYHEKTIGLIVNELISEYQAVLKPIDKVLKNNEIFAGASILGDGKVALVLDTNKIIEFYSK